MWGNNKLTTVKCTFRLKFLFFSSYQMVLYNWTSNFLSLILSGNFIWYYWAAHQLRIKFYLYCVIVIVFKHKKYLINIYNNDIQYFIKIIVDIDFWSLLLRVGSPANSRVFLITKVVMSSIMCSQKKC